MRTIKLTHEQIGLITEALGVAERAYSDTVKEVTEKLVRVRGNINSTDGTELALKFHDKACLFADLNVDISQSKLDV